MEKKQTKPRKPSGPRKHKCGMCNRTRTTDEMLRSDFTGTRYCADDTLKCEQLSRKRKRAARKVAA